MMKQEIIIKLFIGEEAKAYIGDAADLRINIFREFPYLYDGDKAYERKYLNKFIDVKDSLIAIAFQGEKVVGLLTGLPLKYEEEHVYQPWIRKNFSVDRLYYFSEGLIYRAYRGKGIGRRLFELAENWVSSTNRYDTLTLATVIREEDHPQKPHDYISTDAFWVKIGYKRTDNIICTIPWKEIGEENESDKPLLFWSKEMN